MNISDWKFLVLNKAEGILARTSSPLPYKEVAWQAIRFVMACGKSNPLSFALRPVAMHKNLRLAVGINLIVLVVVISAFGPVPSLAQANPEPPMEVGELSESQISTATVVRVKFPLPKREVSQGFWLFHPGVDLVTPIGTPVNAVMAGEVEEIEHNKFGYGNKILIRHDNGYETLYAHLSKIMVNVGDKVTTDSIIGESGSTGHSTGPHLHLEVHENGRPINPFTLLGN